MTRCPMILCTIPKVQLVVPWTIPEVNSPNKQTKTSKENLTRRQPHDASSRCKPPQRYTEPPVGVAVLLEGVGEGEGGAGAASFIFQEVQWTKSLVDQLL